MIDTIGAFLFRCLYSKPVACMSCPEIMTPLFGSSKLCPACKAILGDPRSRTSNKPPRDWSINPATNLAQYNRRRQAK